jgi:hypothetical protein
MQHRLIHLHDLAPLNSATAEPPGCVSHDEENKPIIPEILAERPEIIAYGH